MQITIHENITYDYVALEKTAVTLPSANRTLAYSPAISNNTQFAVVFNQKLSSVNTGSSTSTATILSVYRKEVGQSTKEFVVSLPTSLDLSYIIDHMVADGKTYVYSLEPETETVIFGAMSADALAVENTSWLLITTTYDSDYDIYVPTRIYQFACNPNVGTISNNAQISKSQTFSRFYKLQTGSTNVFSGQLGALVGYYDCNTGQYVETDGIEDELRWLTTDNTVKFLKDLRGHIWRVAVSAAQSFTPHDDAGYMEHSLEWTEIDDTDDVSVVTLGG